MADQHNTNTVPPVSEKDTGIDAVGRNSSVGNGGTDIHRHHHHDYSQMTSGYARADAGTLHPGQWKPYEHRKFANPAPLGLCAFALTTFVLSCINMHARGQTAPHIAVPLAFGYGGLVQLLAGMW